MKFNLSQTRTRPFTLGSSPARLAAALSIALLAGNPAHAGSEPSGSAASWGDFDGDGLEDLYLVNASGSDRLFRNTGDGDFQDVTVLSGLEGNSGTRRASWQDYDGDGRLDLLLVREAGSLQLYRGQREGGFADETRAAGLAEIGQARIASWVDYDRDGRLDLRVETEGGDLVLMHCQAGRGFERREFALPSTGEPGAHAGAIVGGTEASEGASPMDTASSENAARDRGASASATLPAPAIAGRVPAGPMNSAATPAPPTPFDEVSGGSIAATLAAACSKGVIDFSNPGNCLPASSIPMLGMLYPLGSEFNVDANTGFVGIGTTAPENPLHVSSDSYFVSKLESSSPLGTWLTMKNTDMTGQSWQFIATASANGEGAGKLLMRGDPGGTHMALDGAGNVGVGTVSPQAKLHVVDGALKVGAGAPGAPFHVSSASNVVARIDSSNPIGTWFTLTNTDAGMANWHLVHTGTGNGEGPGKLLVRGDAAGTHMTFDGAGRVGIGMDSPLGKLHVVDTATGVIVETTEPTGRLYSTNSATTGQPTAIVGDCSAPNGIGSFGANYSTTGGGWGVYGRSDSMTGVGAFGVHNQATGTGAGVKGQTISPEGFGVYSVGDLAATGTKAFLQPHPTDPARQIRFVCLEGNESGTYFRGSASLSDGRSVIEVPEEFRLVSEEAGLTVQLTARGPAMVWVESVDLERIVIRGSADIELDYFVNGVRRGFADFEPLEDNIGFVPKVRGVPFGTQYPAALRQILVESGVLNADFTPNEATAARLGWELKAADEAPGILHGAPAPAASAPAAPMQASDSMTLER